MTAERDATEAVILDVLPRGRSDDDRPQYERSPLAYAVTVDSFGLLELTLTEDADVSFGDRVDIDSPADAIEAVETVEYDDLSGGAQSELEYAVEDLVEAEADRFVEFYEEAGPITLRLHQLDLLPGIGDTLRDNILDARKRTAFESFDDIEDRISGLHDPKETIVERILEEIRTDDLKYYLFAREGE